MSAYNESDHPRDPLGKFRDKPGASGTSGVSLSKSGPMRRMDDVISRITNGNPRDKEVVDLDGGQAFYSVVDTRGGKTVECTVFDDDHNREFTYHKAVSTAGCPYYNLEVGDNYRIESSRDPRDRYYEQEYIGFGQGQSMTRVRGVESLNGNTGYQYRFPSKNERPGPTLTTSTEPGIYVLVTSHGRSGDTYENLTQNEVDERYGPNFPLHSESNIDQVFDDNAAFLRGENDFYHEGYGL